VTVQLRAVSVKTGEVLVSVTTEKTIASLGVAANAFRFVTFDNLLEADVGITSNEPGLLALRQAIEKSVYALVMEGAEVGIWNFKNKAQQTAYLEHYRKERDRSQHYQYKQVDNTAVAQARNSAQNSQAAANKEHKTANEHSKFSP